MSFGRSDRASVCHVETWHCFCCPNWSKIKVSTPPINLLQIVPKRMLPIIRTQLHFIRYILRYGSTLHASRSIQLFRKTDNWGIVCLSERDHSFIDGVGHVGGDALHLDFVWGYSCNVSYLWSIQKVDSRSVGLGMCCPPMIPNRRVKSWNNWFHLCGRNERIITCWDTQVWAQVH